MFVVFITPSSQIMESPANPGRFTMSVEMRFDLCATWINIAMRHLRAALAERAERVEIWKGSDENAKTAALEREFESAMQAIMAAAVAFDAFYAVVQEHIPMPDAVKKEWQQNGTARFAQITEVLRRAF